MAENKSCTDKRTTYVFFSNKPAIGSRHYPGAVSDFEMFQCTKCWHALKLEKSDSEQELEDHELLEAKVLQY